MGFELGQGLHHQMCIRDSGGVDRVAHQVGVERLEQRFARKDLRCHRSRVGHARAAERLDQRFLDDAVFDVEGQLARCV